ncbi:MULTISPECIES: Abi-alpha family protein [Rhodobacterales]|uniref:Abi-alpha family protein n=1 Tax=Rhodobacterales TaxID=204455 RepID=UPI00329A0903
MTDEENKSGNNPIVEVKNSVNVMGENFDKAAADILKATLQMPATETSGLLADIIGVVGDRVKVYRAERRVAILSDARERLAARGVSLGQSKPMLEGQVYDMIEGMGSAHTSELADMWAGLMANAMDPNRDTEADRGLVSVLQALSPDDAIILNFLAANETHRQRADKLRRDHSWGIRNKKNSDVSEAAYEEEWANVRALIAGSEAELIKLFGALGIDTIQARPHALENIARLGLVAAPDVRDYANVELAHGLERTDMLSVAMAQIDDRLKGIGHWIEATNISDKIICREYNSQLHFTVELSEFGRNFVAKCDLLDRQV